MSDAINIKTDSFSLETSLDSFLIQNLSSTIVDDTIKYGKNIIISKKINIDNIVELIRYIIDYIQQYDMLDSKEKYDLVSYVINDIISDISNNIKLDSLLILPSLIDTIMKSYNKEFLINNRSAPQSKKKNVNLIMDIVFNRINKLIDTRNYSIEYLMLNLSALIPEIIIIADKYKYLDGTQKKGIVIATAKRIINKYKKNTNIEFYDIAMRSLNYIVPNMIDIIIELTKPEPSLSNTHIVGCIKSIFACINKN
jgi:hypothetical protein